MCQATPVEYDGPCDEHDFVDSYGDGCSWYDNNQWGCGFYDTLDFVANDMCCACLPGADPASTSNDTCQDTANGATDPWGDGCEWYDNNPCGCGNYNDDDF